MKFIVDTQLPPRLSKFLSIKGFDSIHTTHFPNGHMMDDETIRRIAVSEDRIIITKDADFFDSFLINGIPPSVLLIRFGNVSNHGLLTKFETHLPKIIQLFNDGAGLVQFFEASLVRF